MSDYSKNLVIKCNKCENIINVSNKEIMYDRDYVDKNGKHLYITQIVCEKCGNVHDVQIDDDSTIKLKNIVQDTFIKFAKIKKSGKSIPSKQLDKFNKSRKNLNKMRCELISNYNGEIVTDTLTGVDFTINFIVVS